MLAGIAWQRPDRARIELRARLAGGGWTPWLYASALGHNGTGGEAIAHALVGNPVWTGVADEVQLRSAAPVEGVSLHLVLASQVLPSPGGAAARSATFGVGPSARGTTFGTSASARGTTVGTGASARGTTVGTGASAGSATGLPLARPHLPAGPGQPPIIARHAWAGRSLPRVTPYYGDIRVAFVHHSVNANGYSSDQVPAILRSIYYFHTYVRGWNDIGYNFAVDAYGRIWEARAGGIDRPVVGAQAGGYNLESFGAVLLGDFAATLPTAAAQQSLARLIAWKLALHGVPASGKVTVEVDPSDASYTRFRPGQRVSLPRVAAHRDGCTTDCPGSDMYTNGMPVLRASVARLVAGRLHGLTLAVGRGRGSARAHAPYPIAHGIEVRQARYLELGSVTMTAGLELPLNGGLRSFEGVPVRSAAIVLQDLGASREGEQQLELARTVTGADGAWAVVLTPRSNLLLRAVHPDAPAAVSALIVVGVAPQLTLGLGPSDGGPILALGNVYPIKRHVVIEATRAGGERRPTLRHRPENKHDAVLRKLVTPDVDGGFSAVLRPPPGRYWVVARTAADAENIAGASPPVALNI